MPSLAIWLVLLAILALPAADGQEALRNALQTEAYSPARPANLSDLPYTVKYQDFRLLITPSLEMDWNNNVTLMRHHGLEDFILKPLVDFDGTYPISPKNVFHFQLGVGYDQYLRHDHFSAFRLVSGSQFALDLSIGEVALNVHDRLQYIQDPAEQAAVAATGTYGGLENVVGTSGTWAPGDLYLTLGYDHDNFVSSSSDFDYLDRASELVLARAGFKVYPKITAGLEATGGFNRYERPVFNDSDAYSVGAFGEWKPGSRLRAQVRGGYVSYSFDQTSQTISAADIDTWYADFTLNHQLTDAFTYSLSAGHEVRLGTQADWIEDSYVRPSIYWRIVKGMRASTSLSFEHGDQGDKHQAGALTETYDWIGWNIGLGHDITKNLAVMLNYRLTLRSSDIAEREYGQNLVGIRVSYQIK